MEDLNKNYVNKVLALKMCLSMLDIKLENVTEKYKGDFFNESNISKFNIFNLLLKDLTFSEKFKKYSEHKCGSLKRFKDRRTGLQYAIDLILGWIAEDAVLLFLRKKNRQVILSGEDRFREFLNAKKISTQADIIIKSNSGKRKIELINDWSNTWENKNHLDLRENKYLALKSERAIVLGISPTIQKALLIDLYNDGGSWTRIEKHFPYGGKPAWQLSNPREMLKDLNIVMENLNQILKFE